MAITRTLEFLHNIQNAKNNELAQIAHDELMYLRCNYELTSLRRALTMYRNTVKTNVTNITRKNIILKNLVLTLDEKQILALEAREAVSSDLKNLRALSNVEAYIFEAEKQLSSGSYIAVIAGLCALTGRRAAEIGCSATFEPIPNDSNNLIFGGQLKTKDRGVLPQYVIPVLGSNNVERVIVALEQLRTDRQDLVNNPQLFHDRCSKGLNACVRKVFKPFSTSQLSVKDLRAIYGEVTFYQQTDKTIAKSKYMSSVLGHGENDNLTGLSYLDFYIEKY